MSSEAELVISVWETVRDHLPASKRGDLAIDLLSAFSDFGFTASELAAIVDEDPDLTDAYEDVFDSVEKDEDDEYEEEY